MKKIILILLFLFVSSQNVFCQEVGRIVSAQGRVDIFKEGSQSAIPAIGDDLISVGDSIRTKSGSKAQVIFRDKSVLKLAQNSKVLIKDYQLDNKERRTSATIELSRGKARAIIAKTPSGTPFVIKTPNAEGTVKGSDVTAFYQAGNSGMFVTEGKLSVINIAHPKNIITVPKGNACVILMDESPKGPRPYLDAEKKLNEEETYVPISISKTSKVSVIKGAVAKVSGIVSIIPKGSTEAHKASINDILGEGDRIETGENGYIEIRLDNNNAINLKPNSKLIIIKLVINPETGEFENIFELTLGKIKARIENLKGNSKFEVKTPQAVCGARGTIMYVDVGPNETKSFFEGGKGYIENLLSGRSQDVGAGENASANDGGGVSNPTYTPETERQSFADGWDPIGGTEGYSSPEGNAGAEIPVSGGGTGITEDLGGTNASNTGEGTTDLPPADVPFTEVVPPQEEAPSAAPPAITGSLEEDESMNFGYYDDNQRSFIRDSGDMCNVNIYGEGDIWNTSMPFVILGNYSDPGSNRLWDAGVFKGTLSGDASFYGWLSGIKKDFTSTGSILNGLFYAFYIKPDGSFGYLKSTDLTGGFYSEGGIFAAGGNMISSVIGSASSLLPQDINSSVELSGTYSSLISGDTFSGNSSGETYQLADMHNGDIFKEALGGTYSSLPTSSWSAVTGGHSDSESEKSYYIAHITGEESWADGIFNGTVTGRDIGYSSNGQGWLGTPWEGAVVGVYYEDGSKKWEAVSMGYAPAADLKFGGSFSGGFGSYTTSRMIDFSTNPYWETNNSERYYWDSANQRFYSNNYTNSGEYATTPIQYDGGSFNLEFDIMAGQRDTGDVCVGLFTDSRKSHQQGADTPKYESVFVLLGGSSAEALCIEGISATGQSISSTQTITLETGKWYHCAIEYDSTNNRINFTATMEGATVISWSGDVPGGFSSNLNNLGVSMNGHWMSSNRWETAYIDNVYSSNLARKSLELDLSKTGISGIMGGIDSPWSGTNPITVMGTFDNPSNYSLWANDGNVTGKTADGGSFSGALGGTIVNNSLKGLFGAFYIRPNPLAGGNLCGYLLSKDITGTFYPGLGMFEADGTLSRGEREYETDVVPENLRDGVGIQYSDTSIGSIGRPGFSGSIEAESAKISDQDNWNLWRSSSGGSYTSPFPTGSWEADMGGWSFDEDSGNEATANSYWIGILKGETAGQVGEFSGEIDVTGLSESGISNSKGSLVGVYNNGIWEALSVGVSTDTNPLTSSGRFVAQGWNLGEGATFDFAGLIGLIGAIWSDVSHPEFISMGEFTPPHEDTPDKQFAWYVQKEWYYQGGGLAGEDGFVSRYDNGDGYTYTTYNDGSGVGNGVGSFYGLSAGVGGSGKLKGAIYSLYIDPAGDAGVLYGDVVGDYYADIKMYEMYSIEGMGLTKKFYNSVGILPANLRDNISWDTLSGLEDGGGFFGGGDINANGGSGNMLNIAGQEWGVWNLVTGGTYSGTTSDVWDIYDLTGMTVPGATSADTNYACGSWLGGFDGTKWSGGEVEGDVNAIWIVLGKDGTLSGRKLSGPLTGYYAEDEAGGSGTWQAGAAGEWVRPQDIIDGNQYSNLLAGPGMDSNIIALGGTNVPITVAYSSIMTGNNGILSATMNTSFYRMGESAADGIWAATITNGIFTSLPGTGWTLTMTDTATNTTATLTGTKWEGSQWAALVSGTGSAANNVGEFTGQAAGTYTGTESGTFQGTGTGTFTQQQTPPQYQ